MSFDDLDLDRIKKECLDSAGYVIFAAILGERDKDGNSQVDYQYRRYHFSLEDTKQAVREFQKQLSKEVDDYFKVDEINV